MERKESASIGRSSGRRRVPVGQVCDLTLFETLAIEYGQVRDLTYCSASPWMVLPARDKSGLDGIRANVGDYTLELRLVSDPAIEPLALPHWTAATHHLSQAFSRAAFETLHDLGQRPDTIGRWNNDGVPVVWHHGEMGHRHLPLGQRFKFIPDHLRRHFAPQRAGPTASIEVFLQRSKRCSLEGEKL